MVSKIVALNMAHTVLTAFLLPDLLASHFRTDWLSWLGLGNQVGSTTDHLNNYYLPSTLKDRSTLICTLELWSRCSSHCTTSLILDVDLQELKIFSDLKQSIPMIPWNKQQEMGLQSEAFILLLHKLGFHLPADVGKCFPRIPHFW